MRHAAQVVKFTLFTVVATIFGSLVFSQIVIASGNLENAIDSLNNVGPSAGNVDHIVAFTLPQNSQPITTSDYVIVSLTNFTNVTAPTSIQGPYIGTPSFSTTATAAKVTGILMAPGNRLTIYGIKANNPPTSDLFQVTIIISEDEDGLIIKNITTISANAFGSSISVGATVQAPVAELTISGRSGPGTFITFTENGTTIGTDTAGGSDGYFTKYFTGLTPNITHQMTLTGIDQAFRTTAPLTMGIFTPIYQNTNVTNLLLPPTIEISDNEVVQGDNFVALGSTVPSGDISLFTETPLRTYVTTANASGSWNYTITDTVDYNPGDYRIYALVQDGATQSIFSNSLLFTIISNEATSSSSNCDISHGNLNCDTIINLTDFSILMYYWGTTNAAADINSDGLVNLTDFSIMMYYWGTSA